jgi:hypothetical protein
MGRTNANLEEKARYLLINYRFWTWNKNISAVRRRKEILDRLYYDRYLIIINIARLGIKISIFNKLKSISIRSIKIIGRKKFRVKFINKIAS